MMRHALTLIALTVASAAYAETATLEWRSDVEAARKEAISTGRPLLIYAFDSV
jgi:hypothetical protein